MKIHDTDATEWVPLRRRVPVLVWVVLALLVLLHGPTGAVWAVLEQLWGIVATLLGGDGVVVAVLSQTAPLALAMAVIVFACKQEWITFESGWSLVVCAVILICGASVGAELRAFCQRFAGDAPLVAEGSEEDPIGRVNLKWLVRRVDRESETISAAHAYTAMTNWDYVSRLGAGEEWPARTPRVALLPEKPSWFGIVGRGVNQLLGYLVFYRPRMFVAALLAGAYIGWAWHRRYLWANDKAKEWSDVVSQRRRAA